MQPHHGALDHFAGRLPSSAPGTIFGFPVARLRDQSVQSKILFLAGVALLVSILVPFHISPTYFSWSHGSPLFSALIWPVLSGLAYLLLTVAPPNLRQQIPPIVLHWLPFSVAYAGIFISHMGFGEVGGGGEAGMGGFGALLILGYSTLVFGLLARIAQPQDQIARIVIAAGSALMIIPFFQFFDVFKILSHVPILFAVTLLLWFVIILLGVLCVVFVVPPQKLPPALQAVDALGPLIAAILLAWLPVSQILMFVALVIEAPKQILSAVLFLAHGLLPIIAYFGVLMMAAPSAYEEAKALFIKGPGGPGGGYPPPGGGYPPPGGGYPPQGGGYPPQGGGYPPQQGGWQ
jgi:hypothetical protein